MEKTASPIDPDPNALQSDIQRWLPKRWADIAGNEKLVHYLRDGLLNRVRKSDACSGNLFVTGDSRSGKTAMMSQFIRSAVCQKLDPDTLDPCDGTCEACRQNPIRYGLRGLFAQWADSRIFFAPVDCTEISVSELQEVMQEMNGWEGIRIVYLDEVHGLVRRGMDEMLLKPLDQCKFLWLASSAITDGLHPMFLRRFIMRSTIRPNVEELSIWLAHRCNEFAITWDDSSTLIALAERSDRTPGLALQVLAVAGDMPGRTLSRELVEEHIFV